MVFRSAVHLDAITNHLATAEVIDTAQAPKKKVAAAPAGVKKAAAAPAKPVNPLYEKRPKTFGEHKLSWGQTIHIAASRS